MNLYKLLFQIFALVGAVSLILLTFWLTQSRLLNLANDNAKKQFPESGIKATISQEADGFIQISANHENDLAAAQGYLAASHYLWQMELLMRSGNGRLSEILGEETLDFDRHFRTLQFDSVSTHLAENMSRETVDWLANYVRGINAYIDLNKQDPPLSYQLTDNQPLKWTVQDVLVVSRMIGWLHHRESYRAYLAAILPDAGLPARYIEKTVGKMSLSPSALAVLESFLLVDQSYRKWWGVNTRAERGIVLWPRENAPDSLTGQWLGIMTSQPVGAKLPLPWMSIRLKMPEVVVEGLAMPGLPGVWAGFTKDRAWTFTMSPDVDATLKEVDVRFSELTLKDASKRLSYRKPNLSVRGRKIPHAVFSYKDSVLLNPSTASSDPNRTLLFHWEGWERTNELEVIKALMTGKRLSRSLQRRAALLPGLQLNVVARNGSSLSIGGHQTIPSEIDVPSSDENEALDGGSDFLWVSNSLARSQEDASKQLWRSGLLPIQNRAVGLEYRMKSLIGEWVEELEGVTLDLPEKVGADLLWVLDNWENQSLVGGVAFTLIQAWQYEMSLQLLDFPEQPNLRSVFEGSPDFRIYLLMDVLSQKRSSVYKTGNSESNRRQPFLKLTLEKAASRLLEMSPSGVYSWQWKRLFPGQTPTYLMRFDLFESPQISKKNGKSQYRWYLPSAPSSLWINWLKNDFRLHNPDAHLMNW